jgi:hypothetical protein
VPFLHVTTRIEGRKHEDLLTEKEGDGFPYFVILGPDGEINGRLYYPHSVASIRETLDLVRRWRILDKKGSGGDRAAAIDAAVLRCELGQIGYGELEEILEPLGELTTAQKEAAKRQYANEEIATIKADYDRVEDKEMRESLLEDAVLIYEEGAYPSRRDLKRWLWPKMGMVAINRNDREMLDRTIKELETIARPEDKSDAIVRRLRMALAKMGKGQ